MAPLLGVGDTSRRGEDEDDEWTRVVRKGSGRANRWTKIPTFLAPRPPSQGHLSVEEIAAHHDRVKSHWQTQAPFQHITDVVRENAATHEPITRAICLGNGSFDQDGSLGQSRLSRPHIQTAAFLTIVKLLCMLPLHHRRIQSADRRVPTAADRQGSSIPCYFQEPRYKANDKAFLESLGHTVLESPAALEMVTPSTLVFGIHLYKKLYCDTIANVYPAMLVGTGCDCWEVFVRTPSPVAMTC